MSVVKTYFDSYISELKATLDELDWRQAERLIDLLVETRKADRQVFLIGNGGSASAASHFACDLAKGTVNFADAGFRRFRAMSLTDNMALITAIGNDISYEQIFVEQLKNYLNPGDVVIVITGSGNSPNVLRAIEFAKSRGAITVGLLGFGGGKAGRMVDLSITVSTRNYGISEDFHLIIEHILTQALRRQLEGASDRIAFLDRDGVINERMPPHQYVSKWEEFRFLPGAHEGLRKLQTAGYKLVVLTNQQGVGRGVVADSALAEIHERMLEELKREGVEVAKILACTHRADDGCACRKPKPGLFHKALNEWNRMVDLERSFFVGDTETDVLAGKAFGIRTVLVGAPQASENAATKPDHILPGLHAIDSVLAALR